MAVISVIFKTKQNKKTHKQTPQITNQTKNKQKKQTFFHTDSCISWASGNTTFSRTY